MSLTDQERAQWELEKREAFQRGIITCLFGVASIGVVAYFVYHVIFPLIPHWRSWLS